MFPPLAGQKHGLDVLCHSLPVKTASHLLVYMEVYMDELCALAQGSSSIHSQPCHNLFSCIDLFFRPKDVDDHFCQEMNILKKLRQADTVWTTKKLFSDGWSTHYITSSPSCPPDFPKSTS